MKTPISLEFYPPNSDSDRAHLLQVYEQLSLLSPTYVSITYGAGGSTRQRTLSLVEEMQQFPLVASVVPHLTTVGDTQESLIELLQYYAELGISDMLALRGDMPSGMLSGMGTLNVIELINLIQKYMPEVGNIFVAAYPEIHPRASSPQADIEALVAKARAGATAAITQYFYNADSYLYLRDKLHAQGCDLPLVAGVMPITNARQLLRFSDACGADIPRWIRQRLIIYQDNPDALRDFGVEVVTALCERLSQNEVAGLHFYTMNRAKPTLSISKRLGWI